MTNNDFNLDEAGASAIIDHFHRHLKQVVKLHIAMFEKLLCQTDELPLDLGGLFEDVANIYLDFSESVSERARLHTILEIEEQLDTDVEPVWRMAQLEAWAKPRVGRTEQLGEPIEDE